MKGSAEKLDGRRVGRKWHKLKRNEGRLLEKKQESSPEARERYKYWLCSSKSREEIMLDQVGIEKGWSA